MYMLLLRAWSTWSRKSWPQIPKGKPGSERSKHSRFPSSLSSWRKVWNTMERGAGHLSAESSKFGLIEKKKSSLWGVAWCTTAAILSWMVIHLPLFFFFLRAGWDRIVCLSLFVEHIVLGIEKLDNDLGPLLLDYTRFLGEVRTGSFYLPDFDMDLSRY